MKEVKKLRIAVLASNVIRMPPRSRDIPPRWSGATERIAWEITEALVRRGHQVTLYASGDSMTHARLKSVWPKSSFGDSSIGTALHKQWEFALASQCYVDAAKGMYDLIHSHMPFVAGALAPLINTPTVHTLHSPLIDPIQKLYTKNQHFISISHNQRKPMPNLPWLATVYHGLDTQLFPFVAKPSHYLVAVGRVHPKKGTHLAIAIAKRLRLPIRILGGFNPQDDYFKKYIQPHVDGKRVILAGHLDRLEYTRTLSHALANVFPLQWEEPFGLTLIEALACGVPVVSFRRGSVPEIITNGKNGFLVKTPAQAVNAVKHIAKIDRQLCRQSVEDRFSLNAMLDGYENAFTKLLSKRA